MPEHKRYAAITVGVTTRGLDRFRRAGVRTLALSWGVVLLAAACSSGSSSGDTESTPAILTVRSDTVEVNESPVAPASTKVVEPGDRVQVTDGGLGTLRLPGLLELELFKQSNLLVPDPGEEPADVVTVELESGHLLVRADVDSGAQVVLVAGNRTLTTIQDGTSYVVCQSGDGNTCLFVIEGEVEWSDDMGVARYTAGEGTFAGPDDPPGPARCDVDKTVDPWLAESLASETTDTLAQRVARLIEGECPEPPQPTTSTIEGTTTTTVADELPSAEGMVLVSIEDPEIGTDRFEDNPDAYRERVSIEGPIVFHVDERAVSNRDFREWVARVAALNDPEEWKRLVPTPWLEGMEGIETQATYPTDEADFAVVGIRWGAAEEYCRGQIKQLVTEIEWEFAAVNEYLRDLEAGRQDWVAEPGAYGDEPPEGRQMKRGNDDTLEFDLYYRLSVVDSAESDASRRGARIRCAASEVQRGAEELEFEDDFTSLVNAWPGDEDELFAVDYHDPDTYHLESRQAHTRGAVTREASRPLQEATISVVVFNVKDRLGEVPGNYRFGVTLGAPETGFLVLAVQPNQASGVSHDWCLSMMSDRLVTMLADADRAWYQEPLLPESHEGEICAGGLDSGTIDVEDIDDPVAMTLKVSADDVVVAFNGREFRSAGSSVPVDAYGFFVQTYAKNTAHIHFDDIRVTVP